LSESVAVRVVPLTVRFSAEARRFSALEPMPLLPEVQKGTMVLPPNSPLSRKV